MCKCVFVGKWRWQVYIWWKIVKFVVGKWLTVWLYDAWMWTEIESSAKLIGRTWREKLEKNRLTVVRSMKDDWFGRIKRKTNENAKRFWAKLKTRNECERRKHESKWHERTLNDVWLDSNRKYLSSGSQTWEELATGSKKTDEFERFTGCFDQRRTTHDQMDDKYIFNWSTQLFFVLSDQD